MTDKQSKLLRDNLKGIERDPVNLAALSTMAHLKYKFTWSILPVNC